MQSPLPVETKDYLEYMNCQLRNKVARIKITNVASSQVDVASCKVSNKRKRMPLLHVLFGFVQECLRLLCNSEALSP